MVVSEPIMTSINLLSFVGGAGGKGGIDSDWENRSGEGGSTYDTDFFDTL